MKAGDKYRIAPTVSDGVVAAEKTCVTAGSCLYKVNPEQRPRRQVIHFFTVGSTKLFQNAGLLKLTDPAKVGIAPVNGRVLVDDLDKLFTPGKTQPHTGKLIHTEFPALTEQIGVDFTEVFPHQLDNISVISSVLTQGVVDKTLLEAVGKIDIRNLPRFLDVIQIVLRYNRTDIRNGKEATVKAAEVVNKGFQMYLQTIGKTLKDLRRELPGNGKVQPAVYDTAIDAQQVVVTITFIRGIPGHAVMELPETTVVGILTVELSKVVKGHKGKRPRTVTQNSAETETVTGYGTQTVLGIRNGFTLITLIAMQHDRIHGGEPTDSAADINVIALVFASMTFQSNAMLGMTVKVTEGFGKCG